VNDHAQMQFTVIVVVVVGRDRDVTAAATAGGTQTRTLAVDGGRCPQLARCRVNIEQRHPSVGHEPETQQMKYVSLVATSKSRVVQDVADQRSGRRLLLHVVAQWLVTGVRASNDDYHANVDQ